MLCSDQFCVNLPRPDTLDFNGFIRLVHSQTFVSATKLLKLAVVQIKKRLDLRLRRYGTYSDLGARDGPNASALPAAKSIQVLGNAGFRVPENLKPVFDGLGTPFSFVLPVCRS